MFPNEHPHVQRLLVDERHEALRRSAGASRLRREHRRNRRLQRRDGP